MPIYGQTETLYWFYVKESRRLVLYTSQTGDGSTSLGYIQLS